jgi:hypothetical protein
VSVSFNKRVISTSIIYILVIVLTSIASPPAYSQDDIISKGQIPGILIPEGLLQGALEQDFIELLALEAEARGGLPIAQFESLNILLEPVREKASSLNITLSLPDFNSYARQLREKLDAIAQAVDINYALNLLQQYIAETENLRDEASVALAAQVKDELTLFFNRWAEQRKSEIEAELQAEGERLGKEAEAKLQNEANREAAARRSEINDKLKAEIKAEIAKTYGGKDEYTSEEIKKMVALGGKMGRERGAALGQMVRAELEAKYNQLAEEERARITRQMEEKAREREAEVRAELGEYANTFYSLREQMDKMAWQKMAEWSDYEVQAQQKKCDIIAKIVDSKTEYARQVIEMNRASLEEARRIGIGQDLPTADELLAQS